MAQMSFHLFCLLSFSLNVLKSSAKGSVKKKHTTLTTDKIFSDIRCSDLGVLLQTEKPWGPGAFQGARRAQLVLHMCHVWCGYAAWIYHSPDLKGPLHFLFFLVFLWCFSTQLTHPHCHQPQATRSVQLRPPQAAMGRFLPLPKTFTLFPLPVQD